MPSIPAAQVHRTELPLRGQPVASRGFLLTQGDYMGTLAAARDLGRHGIAVTLANETPGSLTAHSRYVQRRLRCPSPSDTDAMLAWLLDLGRREPGHVLYPTSDDFCWLLDRHQAALAPYFHLYQPASGSVYQLLNKQRLAQACRALRIDHPHVWEPDPGENTKAFLDRICYPVLIKPQTQAGMAINHKGLVAAYPEALANGLDMLRAQYPYNPGLLAECPGLNEFLIQDYHPEAADSIYSLSGFIAPQVNAYVLRGSTKVLQQPMRIGVGLCFEGRPVNPGAAQQLRRLLESVGYQGAFEAEFIHLKSENRYLLIDVNTRFYGQMHFEIARQLPLARLSHFAAIGEWEQVRALVDEAQRWQDHGLSKFRMAWMLKLFVTTQWLGGTLSRDERAEWLAWSATGQPIDPLLADDDPGPSRAFQRATVRKVLRHPRSEFRKFFRP